MPQTVDFLQGKSSGEVVLKALEDALNVLAKQYKSTNPNDWKVPVATMGFSAKNSVGIPWADLQHQQKLSTYGNTGSASFIVVLDPNQVTMCSILALGKAALLIKMENLMPILMINWPCLKIISVKKMQ